MSRVLGDKLNPLNILSLVIFKPVIDNLDDSKFEALYEAISLSKLKSLEISRPSITGHLKTPILSPFPLNGIEKLALSKELQDLELNYSYDNNASPLLSLLRGLPENLRSLKVTYLALIKSWHHTIV